MDKEKAIALGLRLKNLRIQKGVKQKELAEKLSVSPSRIHDLEVGNRMINTTTLLKIVEIFDVDLNYFDLRRQPDQTSSDVQQENKRIWEAIERIQDDIKNIKEQLKSEQK